MNNKSPLISVIVPCYNVEQYLPKCVDSILCQTYKNLEIWLVDDGSPDKCGLLCDEYGKKDNRIHVIHKSNGGLSDARNIAIDQATGEWITFVDSDDFITDDYVESLYSLADKYNCKVSVAGIQTFNEGQPITSSANLVIREEVMNPIYAVEQMFYQEKFDNSASAKLYHKSLFSTGIRYPKGKVFEDLATTYRLLLDSDKVAFVNKVIYYYLMRPSSIEGAYSPKKIRCALEIKKLMDEDVRLIQFVEKAYRCRMFSFMFHLYLPMPKDAKEKVDIESFICMNRWKVLIDSQARKKACVAALLSYLGFNTVKLFSFL